MPDTTALVPLTHPDTGKPVAAGEDLTLGDADYTAFRLDGKVAASKKEVAEHLGETGKAGEYHARTTRADAGQAEAEPKPVEKKK